MADIAKSLKISTAITPTAGVAASTALNGSILDMSGFEGVLVVVRFGAITAGAVTTVKMQQDTASGGGTMADLAGTSQTVADTDDDETFYIDLYRPIERYVRVVVPRATQNAVIASAEYIQYGARKAPTTHGAGVNGETHVSPAEGTA